MNYRRLPPGYMPAGVMDFVRNRKQLITVTVVSLALMLLTFVGGLLFHPLKEAFALVAARWYAVPLTLAALLAYIPLHELTHGVFMRALSGVRPKYGIRLAYAYAGSTVWFDRRSHCLIALAPVALWGVAFQLAVALAPTEWFWPIWLLQVSNLSGSAGDLYCVFYLTRMKGDLLIRDTGTRMQIMQRRETVLPTQSDF